MADERRLWVVCRRSIQRHAFAHDHGCRHSLPPCEFAKSGLSSPTNSNFADVRGAMRFANKGHRWKPYIAIESIHLLPFAMFREFPLIFAFQTRRCQHHQRPIHERWRLRESVDEGRRTEDRGQIFGVEPYVSLLTPYSLTASAHGELISVAPQFVFSLLSTPLGQAYLKGNVSRCC